MNQRGITLVELLVTIVIGSVVGLLIMNMYITSNRTYIDQGRILDAQRSGRIALEAMSRELRHAGLDPLGTANAGVELATATAIRVTMDLNFDRDVGDPGERVTFRRSGSMLQRGTGAPGVEKWHDMAANVSAFSIDYFGENNTLLAAPVATADVRSLIVTLTLRDDKATGGDFERTYSTGIYCRNLFR